MEIYKTFLLLYLTVHCALCQDGIQWDNHVYTGRHLDDYLTTAKYGPPNVTHNALFIMYKPSCENEIEGLILEELPPVKYMIYTKHDYETFPKAIWYQFDERDDLVYRYKPESCLKVMFFKNGSTIHDPEVYDEKTDKDIYQWVWKKLEIQLSIVNARTENIMVVFSNWGERHNQSPVIVHRGEAKHFTTFLSSTVFVLSTTTDQVLYFRHLGYDFPSKVIIDGYNTLMSQTHLHNWLENEQRNTEITSAEIKDFLFGISFYYLLSQHQVKHLPRFTDKGYLKTSIPEKLYESILAFYFSSLDHRRNESTSSEKPSVAINYHETMCTIVQLTEDMLQQIDEALLPIAENFCDCSLHRTYIYGIREYYHRNILRNHVDRVETHVISAILQIYKELDGAQDWPLEIIGMDGHVRQIYLEPGDMLLYESTTLIHGRPSPFQGKVFANIFAHFQPTSGWDWKIERDVLSNKGEAVCDLHKLYLSSNKPTAFDRDITTEL